MGVHSPKDVEILIAELQERHEELLSVMRGRETTRLTAVGTQPGVQIKSEAIQFAVDDVSTALRRIKARLGKD